MKKTNIYTTLLLSSLLLSCNNEIIEDPNQQGVDQNSFVGRVKPIEYIADDANAQTRTSLTYSATDGMVFAWDEADKITVFSGKSDDANQIYTVRKGAGTHTAVFEGGGFDLSSNERYYALTTTEGTAPSINGNVRIPDKRNITLTYEGQRQESNGSTTHLGAYDFMAATALVSSSNTALFDFSHLGLTVRLNIKMPEAAKNIKFKEIEMFDTENSYHQPERTLDLTKGLDGEEYTPAWDELDINSSEYMSKPHFNLLLGTADNPGFTADESGHFIAYFELPPFDFTNKDVIFKFIPEDDESDNTPYYVKWDRRKPLNAGKAYQVTKEAQTANQYNLKIKINRNWQHGNTTDNPAKSRATGDPGYDDSFKLPKYIYYVYFIGDAIQQVNSNYYNKITISDTKTDWIPSSDNVIFTYKDEIHLDATTTGVRNVYIVASNIDISNSFSGITYTTTKSDIQGLVYSITKDDVNNISEQEFLRDLYSTPWTNDETFVGKLTEPYQDITLYHTAAKVDLKWNNETDSPLPTTGANNQIKVNNVKAAGLYLFKPTENAYATGSYTVSAPITTGTMWNGRQVFYLPQFANSKDPASSCQYNVTIGNKDAEDVTFTPSTANGFTSWLRWLKTY